MSDDNWRSIIRDECDLRLLLSRGIAGFKFPLLDGLSNPDKGEIMGFEDNPADEDPHGECRHEIDRLRVVIRKLREDEWRKHGKQYEHEREWETEAQEAQREENNRERKIEWDLETEKLING